MQRRNHRPVRTCLGCRVRDHKGNMIRLAAAGAGATVDVESRLPGRGGYLHPRTQCLQRFGSDKAREIRSLKLKLTREQRVKIAQIIGDRLDSNGTLK